MNGRVIVVRRPNQPITVNVTPANQSVNLGLAVQFVATVNNATNPAANWTLSPNIGTINSGGLYIATTPVAVNTNITVTATSVQDPSKFHSVTLTVMPAIAVSVSPNSYTLAAGSSPYQFAAFVANNTNQAVTWSIDAGGVGTVTTSGLYSPPAAGAASAVLRATSVVDPTKLPPVPWPPPRNTAPTVHPASPNSATASVSTIVTPTPSRLPRAVSAPLPTPRPNIVTTNPATKWV